MKQKKKFYLTIGKIISPKETKGIKGEIAKFLHLGKPVVVLILKNKEKKKTYYLQEGDGFEFNLTINYEMGEIEFTN